MRRLFARFRKAPRCTVHAVVEGGWGGQPRVYPYRCAHCGRCFICAHRLIGYHTWICRDGRRALTTPSPGVLVSSH